MTLNRRDLLRGVVGGTAAFAGCQFVPQDTTTVTPPREITRGTARTATDLSVTWTNAPKISKRRTQTTAVALDGRLYVIGGIVEADTRSMAVYRPSETRWRSAPPPPKPINHTAAVSYNGRIHVFGGYSGSFLGSKPLDAHWIYQPEEGWRAGPPLPTARGALVAVVAGDRIYAIGGATADGTTARVEAYDPAAETWTDVTSMPTPREHLSAGTIDGTVYVAGGRKGLSPMVAVTEAYDPEADSWTTKSAMPSARAGIAGAVLAERLFVFGGEKVGEKVFGQVTAYHPESNVWKTVTPLPTPRWGLGVAMLDDRIYTVGGGAVPGGDETRVVEVMSVQK